MDKCFAFPGNHMCQLMIDVPGNASSAACYLTPIGRTINKTKTLLRSTISTVNVVSWPTAATHLCSREPSLTQASNYKIHDPSLVCVAHELLHRDSTNK